jgi:phosphohistidine phosphatase SixA
LVIGHEPILGDWSHKLSGSKLAFPKGAAAAFFLSEDCDKAELFWYMHPKYLMKK